MITATGGAGAMDHHQRHRKDTEMMEAEAAAQQPEQNDVVKNLLTMARQFINQGKPSQALQAVVMAMRTSGGENAVFQSLHRARELYISRMQEKTAVDDLAALFAECAIAEAEPSKIESVQPNPAGPSVASDARGTSVLAETGRMQIVLDAFSDGSSFICLQCGGLVSNHRKDEHYAYWCSNM
ncbi:hypothetical protein SLEP1_g16724 [Rubroshorea leprosula]|uniref:C2HC zinc finger plants domain-containing protein n=1 Tax=Rubroshorea leprosula TaxID=152421 RepID=A0AAV5J0L7_9ROSI|nr:hypothetical protein SLEP1_g16724 [Rubroshorea leprosula]